MKRLDKGILLTIFALLGVGLVQVYSSSFIFATETRGNALFFFNRQSLFTLIALVALFVTAFVPWKFIRQYGIWAWMLAGAGVVLTLVPGIGMRRGGAARWLDLPFGFQFEPSELLKISLSLLLASYIARMPSPQEKDSSFVFQWMLRLAVLSLPLALTLKQPDFGSFAICVIVIMAMLFAFGLRWRYIVSALVVCIPTFYFLVMNVPYRRVRVMTYLDPWSDPSQKGFQVIQSMLSFQSGGVMGVGLGQGQGKLFFLPEAHTDFTLAVLGEEMGFVGFTLVLALYGFLVFRGLQISARSEDKYAKALALGLSLTFAFSVFINVGVVLGLLPTKGLTLPFLSYGGSSLVMHAFMFGLLLNVEKEQRLAEVSTANRSVNKFFRSRVRQ